MKLPLGQEILLSTSYGNLASQLRPAASNYLARTSRMTGHVLLTEREVYFNVCCVVSTPWLAGVDDGPQDSCTVAYFERDA